MRKKAAPAGRQKISSPSKPQAVEAKASSPPNSEPEAPAAQPRISARKRFWFIAAILVVLAISQELLFRYAFPLPEVENFNRIDYTITVAFGSTISAQPQRGLSNVRIIWESEPDGFAFEHRLNLYGFRGPDFPIDPPSDRSRVVFVGDSFVEGCGAAEEDTIPMQFARIVDQTLQSEGPPSKPDSRAVEAINLGVAAANFPQYTGIIRDAVPLLRPKTLFLVTCHNDLWAQPMTDELRAPAASFPRLNPSVPRVLAVIDRLQRDLVVPRRTPTGPFPFFEPAPAPTNPFSRSDPLPENLDPGLARAMKLGKTNPWNVNLGTASENRLRHDFRLGGGAEEYLQHFVRLCQEHNCRFVLVYLPHCCTANPIYIEAENKFGGPGFGNLTRVDQPPYRNQQEHYAEVCHRLQIPFLDLTDEYIHAERKGQRLFWPYDGHCNAAGYRLAAEACARFWLTGAMPRVGE